MTENSVPMIEPLNPANAFPSFVTVGNTLVLDHSVSGKGIDKGAQVKAVPARVYLDRQAQEAENWFTYYTLKALTGSCLPTRATATVALGVLAMIDCALCI